MRYPGGKFRCYQKLINLIPPHRVYIETHLGGGAVLRNKLPAEVNIGIDRDPAVVRVFADRFGPSFTFVAQAAEEFIAGYRFKGDEFLYADPPYWPASKRSKRCAYRFSYTEEEHLQLLRLLRSVPCAVMVSGYASAAYDALLSDWRTFKFLGTSHVGRRDEIVWMNYKPGVLHETRFLGFTFRDRQSIKRKRARWSARFRREPLGVQQALLSELSLAFHQGAGVRQ
jgi:site-specific DNA-adenine methylase